jgi:hypothetical protein
MIRELYATWLHHITTNGIEVSLRILLVSWDKVILLVRQFSYEQAKQ